MLEQLDKEQINRIWEHRQHVDNLFHNRLNFFLVFEGVLLGVIGVLYSRPSPEILVLRVIVVLGLSITLIWGYVQARQKYILDALREELKEVAPEYKATLEKRKKVKWPASSTWLLTYVIPTLVALIWIALLFL